MDNSEHLFVLSCAFKHHRQYTYSDPKERFKLYYWRNGNDEVDFVLERNGSVIGIEVKSWGARKFSGINAFKKEVSPDKILLVGADGYPWEDFLKINPIELF